MDEETKKILDEHEKRIRELEKFFEKDGDLSPLKMKEEIWDIEGEQLTLLKFIGSNIQEKIENIALLTLLGYKKKLGKEKIEASEIKRNVGLNGVPTENFGTYMKEMIPQLILRVGKARSIKVAYKLTSFGESKAKKILESC